MNFELINHFEGQLEKDLLKLCSDMQMLSGSMLESVDTNDVWKRIAPEYIADAIKEFQNYPLVAVAWASYIGMAIANGWDSDWEKYSDIEYKSLYGTNGFDDMDEHIITSILQLSLDSESAKKIEKTLQACASHTISAIRHSGVESQTKEAFLIYARACKTMYRIGVSLELFRLGYKYENHL